VSRPDDEKLRELILYLSSLSEKDRHFGATKLNKLLFSADFLAYQRFGSAITGQAYQALPQGPAPRRLKPVMDQMKAAGDIRIHVGTKYRFRQLRPVAVRTADLAKFTNQEHDLICEVVERFWNFNAAQISDESHLFLAGC
jgi:hypothetical protein